MPFCLQCGYDLSGQRGKPRADLVCPECSSVWNPEAAHTDQFWQGWRRSVVAALRLPTIAWGVAALAMGLASMFSMQPALACAYAVIPLIIGCMVGVVSALDLTELPPRQRPHAGVFALVVMVANTALGFLILAACGFFLMVVMP